MLRSISRWAALGALPLAALSCKSDKATGPGTGNSYAGTYSGIIAGATTSGTLSITIPAAAAAPPARSTMGTAFAVDAIVTLTGSLKIAGGSTYPISGSFDTSTGLLSGVTAGPFTITGGFSGGRFTGAWTGPGATGGGFSLLSVPTGGASVALCGVYTGSSNGVWDLSIVGNAMVGEAASAGGAIRLLGGFNAGTGAMTGITSPDDGTVSASGSLTTPANTASGFWSADGGTGTWSGSASACN